MASSRSNLSHVLTSMPPPESTPQLSKRKSWSLFKYGHLEDDCYANSGTQQFKPAAVFNWLNHANIDAEFIVILDADMILRGRITPWEFKAAPGRPVSTPYDCLIVCDNELARPHMQDFILAILKLVTKLEVLGVIIMHVDDLRKFALLLLLRTEEVRADKAHCATNITGDIYESGWIGEMLGYSFGAAELQLCHLISREILIYPGYIPEPGVEYRVFH